VYNSLPGGRLPGLRYSGEGRSYAVEWDLVLFK
jgi:hypothetical protein